MTHCPGAPKLHTKEPRKEEPSLADRAHVELAEMLERCEAHNKHTCSSAANNHPQPAYREAFPMACRELLHSLPGNRNCIDCNARDPEWATTSYGALLCIKCSGRHRSLGVAVSQVRSISMDHWTHKEVVLMLEGGNAQLGGFFARNLLTRKEFEKQETSNHQRKQQEPPGKPKQPSVLTADNVESLRYKTKAAFFYKNQLEAHVERMLGDPTRRPYRGRLLDQRSSEQPRTNHQQ